MDKYLKWLGNGCAFGLLLFAHAHAAIVYDEGTDGDLSGVFSTPTLLTLNPGANTIIGNIGQNGNTGATDQSDADYFGFNIAPNFELTSIFVDDYSTAPPNTQSLIAYTSGTSFSGQQSSDIEFLALFSLNEELINVITNGTGFLAAGEYAFWIQETASGITDYELTFNITPVPLPAAVWLFAPALITLLRFRK